MSPTFNTFSLEETQEANQWFAELDAQWETQHPNWIEDLRLSLIAPAQALLSSNPLSGVAQVLLPELATQTQQQEPQLQTLK